MNNQQLEYSAKVYSDFITFCQMVSEIFEVGKCYEIKGNNNNYQSFNLGRFERVAIDIETFSVAIVFETLIQLPNEYDFEKDFRILDGGRVYISLKESIEYYKISEISKEHFLNMQSRVISLQVIKRQLIKEFLKQN
jgi:hypothetical protein